MDEGTRNIAIVLIFAFGGYLVVRFLLWFADMHNRVGFKEGWTAGVDYEKQRSGNEGKSA